MKIDTRSLPRMLLWAGGLAFLGSILWSMWAETLRPLVDAGDRHGVAMHLIGLPLILGGTGLVVWGGVRFVRDTFLAEQNPILQANATSVGEGTEEAGAARGQNLLMLLRTWRRGTLLMLAGFALIALGNHFIDH